MKTKIGFLLAIVLAVGTPYQTKASIITFDEFPAAGVIPNGYAGMNWVDPTTLCCFMALNTVTYPVPSGWQNGTLSSPNVAFTFSGGPASFTSATATPFTLNSLYLTAAWRDSLQITIEGRLGGLGGTLVDSITAQINTSGPRLFSLDWSNIDTVSFRASGGVHNDAFTGDGTYFALDNMTINEATSATPIPGALPLFAGGLGALGLLGWRRKKKVAALAA